MVHPVPAYAIRVEHGNKSLVYTGDTGPNDALVELARGADLLLSEAALQDDDPNNPVDLHLTPSDAGEHAKKAGVKKLVITHVPPWYDRETQAENARRTFSGTGRDRDPRSSSTSDDVPSVDSNNRYGDLCRRAGGDPPRRPGHLGHHATLAEMVDDLPSSTASTSAAAGAPVASDEQSMARFARGHRANCGRSGATTRSLSSATPSAPRWRSTYAALYPDRVAGVGYLDGVGIGDWRSGDQKVRESRMTPEQAARLEELSERPRTPGEEIEFRVLAWFPDFADPEHAMEWALEDASVDLPISWTVNRALSNEVSSWPDSRKCD